MNEDIIYLVIILIVLFLSGDNLALRHSGFMGVSLDHFLHMKREKCGGGGQIRKRVERQLVHNQDVTARNIVLKDREIGPIAR